MDGVFESLTAAVQGGPHVALAAALAWGILSIVLSPCHLASIPLIVGFIQGRGECVPSRAALLAALFAAGILVTIAVIGVVTAAAGRLMGDVGALGNVIVGVIFILVGMALQEAVGIAAVGQVFQQAKLAGIKRPSCLGVVDCPAIDLRGACHVIV